MQKLCEICKKAPATVYSRRVFPDGKVTEAQYCEVCSKQHTGLDISEFGPILELVKKYPDDPVILYGLGEKFLSVGQYLLSANTFRKIIQLKPDYTAAYRELGKALVKAGKIEEAKEIYKKGMDVAQQTGELQTGKEMRVFLNRLEKG